jgi:rRNA maturation RNase YbeY
LNINIFYDGVENRVKGWRRIKSLVNKVIAGENRNPGDLNFILTTDTNLRKINVKFLNRSHLTDVISFDYGIGRTVSGEIYISEERVRINYRKYKVSYNDEILRVMIHGILHLCGYNDSTDEEKEEMRSREDYWMKKL